MTEQSITVALTVGEVIEHHKHFRSFFIGTEGHGWGNDPLIPPPPNPEWPRPGAQYGKVHRSYSPSYFLPDEYGQEWGGIDPRIHSATASFTFTRIGEARQVWRWGQASIEEKWTLTASEWPCEPADNKFLYIAPPRKEWGWHWHKFLDGHGGRWLAWWPSIERWLNGLEKPYAPPDNPERVHVELWTHTPGVYMADPTDNNGRLAIEGRWKLARERQEVSA